MKYSKINVLKEAIKNKGFIAKIPSILRMFNSWRKGSYKANFMDMIIPLAGIIYIISPIDLIPGLAIPFIGALDDLAILGLIMPRLIAQVDKFLLWEAEKTMQTAKVIDVTPVD